MTGVGARALRVIALATMAALPVEGGGLGLFAATSAPTLDALVGAAVAQFVLHRWRLPRMRVRDRLS